MTHVVGRLVNKISRPIEDAGLLPENDKTRITISCGVERGFRVRFNAGRDFCKRFLNVRFFTDGIIRTCTLIVCIFVWDL